MAQIIKVGLGGQLLEEVLTAAALDDVSTSEVVRRILWGHFEGRGRAESGPREAPAGSPEPEGKPLGEPEPEPVPISALGRPDPSHRSSSLPRPLPSPPGSGFTQETKAKAKASPSGDSLIARCSGRAREAPADASPGRPEGPEGPGQEAGAVAALFDLGPDPAPSPDPPPVLRLPCRATRRGDPSSWGLSAEQVERWRVAFPGLDVIGEARRAEAWLEAHPGRWKTPRGIARFLLSWLERANDRGGYGRHGAIAAPAAPAAITAPAERRGGGWRPAGGRAGMAETAERPAAPPKGSLREAYGRDSFEAWEAELRAGVDEPEELEKCLRDLAKLRDRWEASHGA